MGNKTSLKNKTGGWAGLFRTLDRAVFSPGIYIVIAVTGLIFEFLIELPFIIAMRLSKR